MRLLNGVFDLEAEDWYVRQNACQSGSLTGSHLIFPQRFSRALPGACVTLQFLPSSLIHESSALSFSFVHPFFLHFHNNSLPNISLSL